MKNILSYKKPGASQKTRFEKIHTIIFEDSKLASLEIAREIADLIKLKQENKEYCILGLATGSSPITVYKELVNIHKNEKLSFSNVITFNLDEYHPISKDNLESYHVFMNEHLFSHVNIKKENIHIPSGNLKRSEIFSFCKKYEELCVKKYPEAPLPLKILETSS